MSKLTVFHFTLLLTASSLAFPPATASAKNYIVKDGEPMAEIVVPSKPKHSVVHAAKELQTYIKKISGAELPIYPPFALAKEKGKSLAARYPPNLKRMPVKIYVGESWHTNRLGVTDDGLAWGAYRIKSGKNWLALVGKDTNFTPMGIWGRNRGHMNKEALKEWQTVIGDHHWINPMGKIWINYSDDLDMWAYDQKGTLNAVYGFLRMLGVRWYMPGELGEITPEMKTIELPEIDETVEPDVKIRDFNWAKYAFNDPDAKDQVIWAMRLGANLPFRYRGAHGQAKVTKPKENYEKHPDWYALYNGERDVKSRTPNPCLSSESLFKEQVEYVRFVFDMFDPPALCVAPTDGFIKICQCEKCKGKDTPERGRKGLLSDYVWDYVNRIAKEVCKTHPDKWIMGCAYSVYWLPPEKIGALSPNVAVHVVNARRRYAFSEEEARARRDAVKKWSELTNGKVINFMNEGGARNTPRIFAEDLKGLKGSLLGEEMYGPYHKGVLANPGFTHLHFYVCGRMWWDLDLDVDKLLDEYYRKFYGPAAEEMKAFIDFYEVNQRELGPVETVSVLKEALDLFDKAKAAVDPESVYGKRIALFEKGVERYRKRYDQIGAGRKNVPYTRLTDLGTSKIKVDGVLDEEVWKRWSRLKENETGSEILYGTRFQITRDRGNLYVAVRCEEEPGGELNVTTTKKDDPAIWEGDYVDLLFETPTRSFYQISINPAGTVADLDRSVEGRGAFNWGSKSLVATKVDKENGVWTIEAKIPFTASEQDPLHVVMGTAPAGKLPWFVNVCRQRKRDGFAERSSFSPTGKETFLHPLKFGKLAPKTKEKRPIFQ